MTLPIALAAALAAPIFALDPPPQAQQEQRPSPSSSPGRSYGGPGGPPGAEEMTAEEVAASESRHLKDIRQVTFGFAKAGEGYFSPDGKTVIFQAAEYPEPTTLQRAPSHEAPHMLLADPEVLSGFCDAHRPHRSSLALAW